MQPDTFSHLTSFDEAGSSGSSDTRPARALAFLNPPGLYDPRPNGYSHGPGAGGAGPDLRGGAGRRARGRHAAGELRRRCSRPSTTSPRRCARPARCRRRGQADGADRRPRRDALARAGRSGAPVGRAPPPACTLIPVPRTALDGMLFESRRSRWARRTAASERWRRRAGAMRRSGSLPRRLAEVRMAREQLGGPVDEDAHLGRQVAVLRVHRRDRQRLPCQSVISSTSRPLRA